MKQDIIEDKASESFMVAISLTTIGGFLDAYSYYCRDEVFANAQTGNIVKIAMSLAGGEYTNIFRCFIAIIAFSIGILIPMYIKDNNKTNFYWKRIVLLLEATIILIVSLIPIETHLNIIANSMISFLCAMQMESFKKMLGSTFSSTMCTGNLRRVIEDLYNILEKKDIKALKNIKYYFFLVVFFILGATIGRLSSYYFFEKSILLTIVPIFIAFIIIGDNFKRIKFIKKKKKTSNEEMISI